MADNDVHLTTLGGGTPRVTPSPPLASYGASYQQEVFDPYSPLSHSTSSLPGSANSHLSFVPSLPSTSVLSMPNLTDTSFPMNTMSNTGSAYSSTGALPQMSMPAANMASAEMASACMATTGMETTGMATVGMATAGITTPPPTVTSAQMAMHPNAMWRYPFANQHSHAGPRHTTPQHSHYTDAAPTYMTHQGFHSEFPQSAIGGPYPSSVYQVPAQQMASMPINKVRGDGRKCRKVYGMENKEKWCTQCRWKKACVRFVD